jgi:hypothetical protein
MSGGRRNVTNKGLSFRETKYKDALKSDTSEIRNYSHRAIDVTHVTFPTNAALANNSDTTKN